MFKRGSTLAWFRIRISKRTKIDSMENLQTRIMNFTKITEHFMLRHLKSNMLLTWAQSSKINRNQLYAIGLQRTPNVS